jgi:UDPglucose--hexose-1-phosphate uridylyltransferase
MPELRQNLATKEWVIIASDRPLRPQDMRSKAPAKAAAERDPKCPFCPGNEKESDQISVLGGDKGWRVRVVGSKVPALVAGAPKVEPMGNVFRRLPGEGLHEIIVESPSHSKSLAELERDAVEDVLGVYQERFKAAADNMKVALTLLFKNHPGTSISHPHSQLVACSVVPAHIRHRMDEAQKYYEQNKECVVCRMVEEELAQKARVVVEGKSFVAFVLFAALSPFHLWIVPKKHSAAFHELSASDADDLAGVLQTVLRKLKNGLGDPEYSFVIQSIPQDRGATEAFHWYMSLVVRVGATAGFELGSGMHLNSVVPEHAAKFLVDVKA